MKRICSLFLTLLMILALSVPAGAVNNDIPSEKIIDGRSVYSYSMDEIQDLLLDFFEENNISLEPGTRAYYSYICEQLLGNTDEELRSSPYWKLFHAYMAVYKNEAELAYWTDYNVSLLIDDYTILSENPVQDFVSDASFLTSTIGSIRNEMLAMDAVAESERESSGISPLSSYSASDAIAYAREYALDYNDNYESWTIAQGGDCANFASQCLYAGGKPMNGTCSSSGRYTDTTKWFHLQFGTLIKSYGYTTTWINCGDFKRYWQGKCSGYYLKSSLPDLIETCSAGDIVQLCNEDTIVPYHTIIITYNNGSTIKYCGHSNDRLDEEGTATVLEPTENDFLIFKF